MSADNRAALPEDYPLPPENYVPQAHGNGLIDILYRSQSAGLFRLFVRRTASRDEASDMVQEAFSRLAKAQVQCRIDRPEAFLNRLARNLLADRRRRSNSRPLVVPLEPEDGLQLSDPVRLLETRDMLNRLELAMARLKPRTREIFKAHRLDGMTYSEISVRTGLSIKGVEKQMSKAIAQIDRMLDRS